MNKYLISTKADLVNISSKRLPKQRTIYIAIRNLHFSDINPRDCGFEQCTLGHGENLLLLYHSRCSKDKQTSIQIVRFF